MLIISGHTEQSYWSQENLTLAILVIWQKFTGEFADCVQVDVLYASEYLKKVMHRL